MSRVIRWGWMPVLLAAATPAPAQHHGAASFASHASHGDYPGSGVLAHPGRHPACGPGGILGGGYAIGAVGGGYASYGFPYFATPFGVTSPVVFQPILPIFVNGAFGPGQGGGLMLPMPPAGMMPANPANPANVARPRRPNPERARELVEIGDRSFRGGNLRRAEDRYLLAARADPNSPMPRVHLAQVAMVRKDYAAAADLLRVAVAVGSGTGWLTNAPDIQAIFAEPGDFARHLGELESHLQANPGDRDGWFVLGVELFFSGRTQPAADAFRRLTDRRPDDALAAFLDASTPRRQPPN